MKKIIILSLLFATTQIFAKSIELTLSKGSYICSVGFESKKTNRVIQGGVYRKLYKDEVNLNNLYMEKERLEVSTTLNVAESSEFTGYYISAYFNNVGPVHIPIPRKNMIDTWGREYLQISLDKYMPCSCFPKSDKPSRCNPYTNSQINNSNNYDVGDIINDSRGGKWRIIARDKFGNFVINKRDL